MAEPGAEIRILYQDEALLAVDKPAGLAVHRSRLVGADTGYLIDHLRAQVGGRLHLAHRLDRATSGVLLVARNAEVAAHLGQQMMAREVERVYLAVARGWPPEEGEIDYPLAGPARGAQPVEAITRWRRLATVAVPIPMGRYPEQRYSLLEVRPLTGRHRQIRRHLHHISKHILGDTSHGRGDHNRLLRAHFGLHRMFLHAWQVAFRHPLDGRALRITAPPGDEWPRLASAFGWTLPDAPPGPNAG